MKNMNRGDLGDALVAWTFIHRDLIDYGLPVTLPDSADSKFGASFSGGIRVADGLDIRKMDAAHDSLDKPA